LREFGQYRDVTVLKVATRGKRTGYNLVISGGNVRGEIPSENRQVDYIFFI
jgi:hypothetical protein